MLVERGSIISGRWRHPQKWILAYLIIFGVIYLVLRSGDFCGSGRNSSSSDYSSAMMVSVSVDDIISGQPIQLPQDHKGILNYIWRNNLIESPSGMDYKIDNPKKNPSRGQGQLIQKLFQNMTNGFFVEAGGLDGETRSNSLSLEMNLGWKGLLVEADPSNYALLKKKNRKAWTSNTCLAIKPHPHKVDFMQSFNVGKILPSKSHPSSKRIVTVQCIPLFSLLSALNVSTVDYFSLDVEGNELQVLKTVPFDKILIKTLSVEFSHTAEGKDSLRDFMESKGYKMIQEIRDPLGLANDFIFVHSTVIDYAN